MRQPAPLIVFVAALALILSALACNLPSGGGTGAPRSSPLPVTFATPAIPTPPTIFTESPALLSNPTPPPSPNPTHNPPLNPPPLALDHTPLVWFAPLPPMPTSPGREFTGSEDFQLLFEQGAPWVEASSHIQVFKLYGEWVAYHASDEALRQAVLGIQQRNLAIAVEAGPLNATAECGQGVEGFAGIEEGLKIARRIREAGGQLHLIALDEPYYYGHYYDGPNACHWTDTHIAKQVGDFIQAMRALFPDVKVGDIEPLVDPAGAPQYQAWLVAFRAVNGYDLSFLHLDIDWSRPEWPQEVKAVQEFGLARGVPVGLIYTGNHLDASDQAWVSIAGERVKRYEQEANGKLGHLIFQSWNDKPDQALPESKPFTFTGLIRTYFDEKSSLGVHKAGSGANLAFQKPVRYSQALPGFGGEFAVEGNPATWWNSGGAAPQWIEIDLGQAYNIQSIRLLPSQSPPGITVHKVRAKGSSAQDPYLPLYTFEGKTEDSQPLLHTPATPWAGVRYLRVETLLSPSWVAWREIEIFDAGALPVP